MRVTVIATGLVDDHMGRRRDRPEPRIEDHSNVTPLYREPVQPERTISAEQQPPPEPAREPQPAPRSEFISPFEEDELDVPTFLRNAKEASSDDEDEHSRPAFLRRSAD